MKKFFKSNSWEWRLSRTIVQGILGVLIANIDTILGLTTSINAAWRPIITAAIMAVLSPIMAEMGGGENAE